MRSPAGYFFAVGMAEGGVRVFNTTNGRTAFEFAAAQCAPAPPTPPAVSRAPFPTPKSSSEP